jgi:hypothetical protein
MSNWEDVADMAERDGLDKADVLRFQIEQATRELMSLERVPNPADQIDGTVIRWSQTFGRSVRIDGTDKQVYTYVAIKAAGRWYVTGNRHNRTFTSGELRERLAQAETTGIDIVTAWTPLGTPTTQTTNEMLMPKAVERDR